MAGEQGLPLYREGNGPNGKSRQTDKQTNTTEHVKGRRRGLGLGALLC